jgi:GTP cyclohydrolase IA
MANDPKLGQEIHQHLLKMGLETPMRDFYTTDISKETQKEVIEKAMLDVMKVLRLDYTNDSMADTPKRIAKMYVDEVMYGLDYNNFPKIMTFENSFHDAGMVVEKNIAVKSLCSHHLVPTIGKATIAYIPGTKVIGLSKLNRIVDFFARRPQEQERYGMQLWAALTYILETEDVAVYVDAKHYCVSWRGVKDDESSFVTSKLGGGFMTKPELRQEFYNIARSC